MTTITIYGVGLIGGSLALCFKGREGYRVIGHSPSEASVQKYLKREVVDEATTDFETAALAADFIFVCVPVGMLEEYVRKLSELPLKPGCVITDVGSTKRSIVEYADGLAWKEAEFIGGHPMAGKEKSGVEAATTHLFENAFYVLTPGTGANEAAYDRLADLLHATRAHLVRMDACEHDTIVGAISHLPHIIAVALVNQIAGYNEDNSYYERLAAGGFRDITRIASSDPVIWRDILINNREVMLKLMGDWESELGRLKQLVADGNAEGIESAFQQANRFREKLPERRKGVMTAMYDVYVDVPDQPGVIGQIATQLGQKQINLSNIQIMENRLDVPGVLRLSFRDEKDLDAAVEELKEMGYPLHF